MSHITIIISKTVPTMSTGEPLSPEASYDYRIPVPHDATPAQVGRMVRQAFRHLEGAVVSGHEESDES